MKRFIRDKVDDTPIVDNVFAIVRKAADAKAKYGKENVIDATIGSLYNEEGTLVAFDSVFENYNAIENTKKAKYAASFNGNADFREQVYTWVVQNADVKLAHTVVATPGGSGAVSSTFIDVLDENETVIVPEIAWGSYKLMASMNNIEVKTYSLFEEDHFNVKDVEKVCKEVMAKQGKVLLVINDPCHNPTGYTLTKDEWKQVVACLNELSKEGPVVLLNDIAYIDYAYDFEHSRDYLETFNALSDNVVVVVAFSCSKTLTSYGLRCGAALLLGKNKDAVREIEIVMEKTARATWSNIPNAAMDNFVYVTTTGREAFDKEKGSYVSLMKQRSEIFLQEADACGLAYYPYKEGFFVTLKIEDKKLLDAYHETLMANNIFTVKVNKGIRVAICSLSVKNSYGLAKKMKDVLDTLM